MSKYRKSARGQECQVRIDGICNGNPETTVLAHLNGGGMGMKQPDIFGAFACSACHNEIDRRTRILDADHVKLMHLQAIIRTQQIWIRDGLLKI